MLMPTCLKPYPGELLYGWIVRLFRVNMYDSIENSVQLISRMKIENLKWGNRFPFVWITDSIWTIYARRTKNSNVSRMSGA